jgi:hypothetical protein
MVQKSYISCRRDQDFTEWQEMRGVKGLFARMEISLSFSGLLSIFVYSACSFKDLCIL